MWCKMRNNQSNIEMKWNNSPCESGRMRGLLLLVSNMLQLFEDIMDDCGDLMFERGSIGNLKIG